MKRARPSLSRKQVDTFSALLASYVAGSVASEPHPEIMGNYR